MENSINAESKPKKSFGKWLPYITGGGGLILGIGIGIGLIGSLATSAIATSIAESQVDTRLKDAEITCADTGLKISDDGQSLTLDVQGEDEFTGALLDTFYCLSTELEMPEYVTSHVGQTTSLDGRQTEVWDEIEFAWSYHPDRGLDGVFRIVGTE